MKELLIITFLFISIRLNATDYYVKSTGDDANTGLSSAQAFLTLAHACSHVTEPGSTIHIAAGTYIETKQSVLAVGVSIEGTGITSIIHSHISSNDAPTILASSIQGTNGNQHISFIKMDGDNLTAMRAVWVQGRSNFSIHDCTFVDFFYEGIIFRSGGTEVKPTVFSTGNTFYNNIVTNCADYNSGSGPLGNLCISGQEGMLIHDNTITSLGREHEHNGSPFMNVSETGYTKGMKIYNNTFRADQTLSHIAWFVFALNIMDGEGTEIYNNNLYGEIDIGGYAGRVKGGYDYSVSVHDNFIGSQDATSVFLIGILIEQDLECSDVLIYRNHIKNCNVGIIWFPSDNAIYTNIYIHNNLFDQVGRNYTGQTWTSHGIQAYTDTKTGYVFRNWYIQNNVFSASDYPLGQYTSAIILPNKANCTVDHIYIQNNVIQGFDYAPIQIRSGGTIDYLWVQNNLYYGNGNNNVPKIDITPTNYTNSDNIISNPLFVSSSDFHLQVSSPAKNSGINVGSTTDIDGNTSNYPPNIGAYNSNSMATLPIIPVYQNSVVENATPSLLEITYSVSLVNTILANTAFIVYVKALKRNVSSVTISGNKVWLTLASAVVFGDKVTVSYTKPATNPLQTASGGQAATISAQPVTNRVSNPATLGYINSAVGNSSPSLLEINFNLTLANILPAVSALSVRVNSISRTVISVAISGTSVILTLATEVFYGDVVTVAYTKPANNPLQSTSGLQAETMSAQSVTNKVSPLGPVYVSAAIENMTSSILEITYNEILDLSVPSTSAFVVMVNGVKRDVSSVSISGNNVLLTLASPVAYGDIITVSYIKPASNQLKKATGETADSFSFPQQVTNKLANNLFKKGYISIYPNPAREFVNISILETSLEPLIFRIFDLSGKLCIESQLNAGANNKVLINIKSGMYIVQVLSGSVIRFVQKLIVV